MDIVNLMWRRGDRKCFSVYVCT